MTSAIIALIICTLIGLILLNVSEGESVGIGTVLYIVVLSVIGGSTSNIYTSETSSVEIINLKDNGVTEGGFFLGCGNIDGVMKYTFYYKENENAYRLKHIDCDDITVSYTTGTPRYETTKWFKDPNEIKHNRWALDLCTEWSKHKLYIPHGSIKTGYVLDAQ